MDLYISTLLLFLANFEIVTRILRTEASVMLCVFQSQEPLAMEKTHVTDLPQHMVDNLNITNCSGFGRKSFETLWVEHEMRK